jgi:Flp pilus assembly protein TadD
VAALGLLLPLTLNLPGCQSEAAIAFRGARHYSAGNRALDRGDGALAVVELRQAAVLLPQASEIQNHLGLAYLAQGEEEPAREAFRRAIELDCDNQAARINLARITKEGGDAD